MTNDEQQRVLISSGEQRDRNDLDDSRSQACSAACISERARTPISCVMYGVRQMTARRALIILVYMMAMYMCVDGPYRL